MFTRMQRVLCSVVLLVAGCDSLPKDKPDSGIVRRGADQEPADCSVSGLDLDNYTRWELPQWEKVSHQCPNSAWAGLNYARLLKAAGQFEAARTLAERFNRLPQGQNLLDSLPKVVTAEQKPIEKLTTTSWNFQPSLDNHKDMVFVAIGNMNYKNNIDTDGVRFAHNDASEMGKFAKVTLGIPKDHLIVEQDQESSQINSLFNPDTGRLKHLADQGVAKRLFFYYSGHGIAVPDRTGQRVARLVGTDARPNTLNDASVALDDLVEKVAQAGYQELILVVDACFSGNLSKGTKTVFWQTTPEAEANIKAKNAPPVTAARTPLRLLKITATGKNQEALQEERQGHGLMTYHFLRALTGAMGKKVVDTTALQDWLPVEVDTAAWQSVYKMSQRPLVIGENLTLVRYR
ncbi:MAG: caspase family protein [Magnetococcales bacterium]|nr:caspase family protein [Magnetococcales bacterium]